ncbi:MAG: SHOCT domain-containing protein [Flavobacteriales bacterium]|jgi:hypothetical protein|nr:SHOCT domain-containing protein [Flavobacteriales bacterium]
MKKIIVVILFGYSLFVNSVSFSQISATYNEVSLGQKKGEVDIYINQNGEEFKVGDTITLGVSFRNDVFEFIQQKFGLEVYPLTNIASHSKVIIKKISIRSKLVIVNTTKPNGYVYGLFIYNFDSAIANGEIKSKLMSSDEALAQLKKAKDKLDLGLISQEDFEKLKAELVKYIK